MSPFTNREIIDRYVRAAVANDLDAQDALLADDLIEDYPQSGERFRGKAKRRAMFDHYPGRAAQEFVQTADRVIGSEDRWVVTPSMTPMRIVGPVMNTSARARSPSQRRGLVPHSGR